MTTSLAIDYRSFETQGAWRQQFRSGCDVRRYEQAQQPLRDRIAKWPKELADMASERWHSIAGEPSVPIETADFQRMYEANRDLQSLSRELDSLKLDATTSDGELIEWAERCANLCRRYPSAVEQIASKARLPLSFSKTTSTEGRLLRLQCSRWWRRKMRAHFGQSVENSLRSRGLVRRGRAAYCTDWALERRQQQKTRLRAMMQEAIAINEAGEQFELFALAEKSIANPAVRRAELMTRIRGFERIADECGHVALFGTHTAPSAFHPQLSKSGANPLYNGSTVRDAQKWLSKVWARARAAFHRLSLAVYGFRVAEPHHDGTPHWHTLLFMAPQHVETVQTIMREAWLSEYGDEKGAREHRCTFKHIDREQGSAVGYIAKYVAKNIDGFRVGNDDEADDDSTTTAHRVEAWASTHRIRQFQQIGGAPVGIWRECRRIELAEEHVAVQAAVQCADEGDWCGFSKASQGIRLWKEQTGECNAYREVKPPQVVGVQAWIGSTESESQTATNVSRQRSIATKSALNSQAVDSLPASTAKNIGSPATTAHIADSGQQHQLIRIRTRLHEWRVKWKGSAQRLDAGSQASGGHADGPMPSSSSSLGPVSITVRDDEKHTSKNWRHDIWKLPLKAMRPCTCRECRGLDPPVTYEGALKWTH